MKIVVLGGGESGFGAAYLAKKKGIDVFLSDKGMIKEDFKKLLTDAKIEIDKLLAVAPTDASVLLLHAFQQLLTGNVVGARDTVRELSERYPGMELPPQLQALLQMP